MPSAAATRASASRRTLLVLAAVLALSLAGCGSSGSDDGGAGASGEDAASVDDGNNRDASDEEREAAHPLVLDAYEQLLIVTEDTQDSTELLMKNEQKRAEKWLKLLEDVEIAGRNYIEAAREDAKTWDPDEDPLCTEAVEWPPPMGYQLLPPYEQPFSLRADIGDEVPGITRAEVADALKHVEEMEAARKEFPEDPLMDESKLLVSYAEESIRVAEDEIEEAESTAGEIKEQEAKVTTLYAGWDEEHDDLYEGATC